MLRKNEMYTVNIDGYSSEGLGVGRIDSQVVFIKGAIRGETCRVKIMKAQKNLAYARLEEIITPSPHRIAPQCPVYGKCGGCHTLHMDYEEELAFKVQRVKDALGRIGGVEVEPEVIGAPDRRGYRNKAVYNVGSRDGKPIYGFYRPHSHDIVDGSACIIQNEPSKRAMSAVRRWMEDFGVSAYDEQRREGCVRRVFCRWGQASGELQVTVITAQDEIPHRRALTQYICSACPEVKSIVQNVNKTVGNTVISGEFRTVWGSDRIDDRLCGLTFSLSPMSFYQVNHDQAQRLYARAREYAQLTGRERVIDLYCGTGTITLYMAQQAQSVLGVEIVAPAIEDAKKNAERNGVTNVEFVCADAAETADRLVREGTRPDAVIVDPPRKGLAPEVPGDIAAMQPSRVVYVSCDPETLARDVKRFADIGYAVTRCTAVDMFPGTGHVETVVLMARVKD